MHDDARMPVYVKKKCCIYIPSFYILRSVKGGLHNTSGKAAKCLAPVNPLKFFFYFPNSHSADCTRNICWYLISARSTGASGIKYLAQGYHGKNLKQHWVGTRDLSIVKLALYQLSYLCHCNPFTLLYTECMHLVEFIWLSHPT